MSQMTKRKGLAKVLRIVSHKEMLVAEVVNDPDGEFNQVETLCFLNKTKQLWMLDQIEEGDFIGIELPLKPGRGVDPVTWALPNHDQPEDLQSLNPLVEETVLTLPQPVKPSTAEARFSFGTAKFTGEEAEWLKEFCAQYPSKGDAFEDLFRAALPMFKLLQK